jgi:hypothetical protein
LQQISANSSAKLAAIFLLGKQRGQNFLPFLGRRAAKQQEGVKVEN